MRSIQRFTLVLLLLSMVAVGCGKESSFSLLSEQDSFKQTTGTFNSKVDILWVIDNSGSMETSQDNVISNLNSFIGDFATKNLDFKMAVTTTDAYRVLFNGNHNCSRFRDGLLNSSCNTVSNTPYSGVRVMTPSTADLLNVFAINTRLTNSSRGIYGSGDERAFQSIRASLEESLNAGFIRDDSFLSVIILSDEDDFSHNSSTLREDYNYSGLHTVQSYVDFLDSVTGSTPANRRYNVNAMAIFDSQCRDLLNTTWSGRKIAQRYGALIDNVNTAFASSPESQGLKTSLCGNFADDLQRISEGILTLSSQFVLRRIPIPETIEVLVDGVPVPHRDTNPAGDGGWRYEAGSNSIFFVGLNYIPSSGASISVNYDPVAYGQ